MNKNNIFKGKCYLCNKTKFITRVDSWSGVKTADGSYIRGSWRNFCNDCVKEWGWVPNRSPNTCSKCKKIFLGSKDVVICSKCWGVLNG
jgi:hypothetical protein